MPRPFNDYERDRLREKLVEAGKRLLNRVGLRGLVVDDIAREAGISKGSFYAFFPSKEDFVLSVFEEWEERYRGALLDDLRDGPGTGHERLERFFSGIFELFEREPGLARLGFVDIMHIMERLPPERLAAHQANDARSIGEAAKGWAENGIVKEADLPAIEGILDSLFILAMHRDDFKPESYAPAMRLLAEALAMRLSPKGGDGETA